MIRRVVAVWLMCLTIASGQTATKSIQDQIFRARDNVLPALVHIQPVIKDFNTGELKKQAVIGSGVIFHPDGYVVTNYHVAGKAERIICTLNDKEQVPATYIGGDPPTDLAIIKLDLTNYHGKLSIAQLGDSDSLQVGQQVLAMGSPLSLARSVSAGVISTKDRYFSSDIRLPSGERTGRYNLWIQTDAAINPGNSGGPLVDMTGKVVGINSRAAFLANNVGFAIPVNIVKQVTEAVLRDGKVSRSWIGVDCQALQELESYFGTEANTGVLIASVDAGSPAEEAQLQAGDIILAVDDRSVSARFVEELPPFYNRIASQPPGEPMNFRVLRGDQEQILTVIPRSLGDLLGEDFESGEWDFTVKGVTHQMQIEYQLQDSTGVMIAGVKPVGVADGAGVRGGDVIVKINKTPIITLADFIKEYTVLVESKAEKILLTIKRRNGVRLAVLNIEKERVKEELGLTDGK
ncbi:MAG: trypsin-like peptidase domain-containing protein [candidate division Zixibacteria bacterium]|nr:trypsin-like peptidase domain-containing protein [candidate division Zixibacteria bacterium]